jgi:hypothetical protein
MNELLSKVLQQSKLTLNLTGSLYNRNLIEQKGLLNFNQSDVNLSVGGPLFNGRMNFTVGGTFDVPIQGTTDFQQTIRLFPDVTIEVLLNKSGSVRASFFYKENIDFLSISTTAGGLQTRRYGASISYGKEFDSKKKGHGKLKPVTDSSQSKATPPPASTEQ